MKLFLVTQSVNEGYDTYDGKVVCAEDENDAKDVSSPSGNKGILNFIDTWAKKEDLKVEYLGEAKGNLERRIVLTSFNAG